MSWFLAFLLPDLFLVSHSPSLHGRGFNPCCLFPSSDSGQWEAPLGDGRDSAAMLCLLCGSSFCKTGSLWFYLLPWLWPLGTGNTTSSFCGNVVTTYCANLWVTSLFALGFSTLPALVYMRPCVKFPLSWTLGVVYFFSQWTLIDSVHFGNLTVSYRELQWSWRGKVQEKSGS